MARAANKTVQEVEPEEEIGDSDDILKTLPSKAKPSEGGSSHSKKKSTNKSLAESIQRWSKSQATKSEVSVRAQEEFYQYIAEKRARKAATQSFADEEDSIVTCMGLLNAIEGLDDMTYAQAVKKFVPKKEMRMASMHVTPERPRRLVMVSFFIVCLVYVGVL